MADLPIVGFIQERLAEADVTLDTRQGTAFYDLFVSPQQFMLDPLMSAMEIAMIAQSVRRILLSPSPDAFNSDSVDDIAANVYVLRNQGAKATCIVRVFYANPLDKEFPALTAEFGAATGISYFNVSDILISSAQMALNLSGSLFYMDVPVIAEQAGSQYDQDVGGITSFINDLDAVSVTNITPAIGGLSAETNTELLDRAAYSIGVRDFETIKGINASVSTNFPFVTLIQSIGFGDPEMMRDILFNAHVGGNTDVYVKTPGFQVKSTDIVNLDFDLTREVNRNFHMELLATSSADPKAVLGTPFIVSTTMKVVDSVIETSAQIVSTSVPPSVGIDLSANQWIKLQVDAITAVNIKVSGAVPSQTQRFEIMNSINSALGAAVAQPYGTDMIILSSQKVGTGSQIQFLTPDSPRTDGTLTLFPSAAAAGFVHGVSPGIVNGIAAVEYAEGLDYSVDYETGLLWKLPGSNIRSGDTVSGPSINGVITSSSAVFASPTLGAFSQARPGDEVVITVSSGIAPGSYFVVSVTDSQHIVLQNFSPTSSDSSVQFYIKSHQVVVVFYRYSPLSIDIGPQVVLSDGVTRGIRPGRTAFTITDVPFINILSIEQIDPDTKEGLGIFLVPPSGYGSFGYGSGGYGAGQGSDYQFYVNKPPERFSVFEDAFIALNSSLFGNSYRVTYNCAPEILSIHNFARQDQERVTGADVLPKNFIPGFVDMDIKYRPNPSNANALTADQIVANIKSYIQTPLAGLQVGVVASSVIDSIIMAGGALSVKDPYDMNLTVHNTDGTISFFSSQDILQYPAIKLPKQTDNYASSRIVQFYAGNITLTAVT